MCAPAAVLGAGMEGRVISPLLPFYWVINNGRDCCCAPPPFHVCRASRHYLPPPRSVIRCQSGLGRRGNRIKDRAEAFEGVGWGSGLCYPGVGAPTLCSIQAPGSDWGGLAHPVRRFRKPHEGYQVISGGTPQSSRPSGTLEGWRWGVVSWRAWPLRWSLERFW